MLRILLLTAIVLSPGCNKTQPTPEAASPRVANAPSLGQVIATLKLPSGNDLAELGPMIDGFESGSSAMAAVSLSAMLAKASGTSLLSADLSKPVALAVLNPEAFKDPVALLVRATDQKALETAAADAGRVAILRDGLTLIATSEVAESAQEFVFATLAEPSSRIVAVVYPKPLLTIYGEAMDQGMAELATTPQMAPFIGMYRDALVGAGEQTDRIVLSLASSESASSLLLHFHPTPQSTMASFVAAQVASKHDLLRKLPATTNSTMVYSGDMRAGDAKDALIDFGNVFVEAIFPHLDDSDEIKKVIKAWYATFDGKFAGTMSMNLIPGAADSGVQMSYLMGTHDPVGMREGWVAWMKTMSTSTDGLMETMGMKFSVDYKQDVAQIDGITVDQYTSKIDPATVPAEQASAMNLLGEQIMHLAVFDNVGVMVSSNDSLETLKEVIETARGRKAGFAPQPALGAALADSMERGESLLFFMDIAGLGGGIIPVGSVVMAMGRDKDALVVRIAVGKK